MGTDVCGKERLDSSGDGDRGLWRRGCLSERSAGVELGGHAAPVVEGAEGRIAAEVAANLRRAAREGRE